MVKVIELELIEKSKNNWSLFSKNNELSCKYFTKEKEALEWAINFMSSWSYVYRITVIDLNNVVILEKECKENFDKCS